VKMTRTAALTFLTGALTLSALGAHAATATAGRSFIAKKGTVSIVFNTAVVATFQRLGIEFNTGNGAALPATAAYPALSIAPAASQPSRAPRTPLSTAKPAGIVYIGTPEVNFYQQQPTANTQGGIVFPEVTLGAHPALEGEFSYTHTGSTGVNSSTLSPLFLLNTRHIKPVLRGSTLTLKKIPMTLAPAALPFFSLFGSGFTAGEAIGTLTIKAVR
jgi:hypothetical protein